MWQSLKLGFDHLHGLCGECDSGLISGGHQGDHGMCSFPSHGGSILDHSIKRIEQSPVPVLFQNPPTALDRVVFTMIWRIIREADSQVKALGKLHETLHELGAPTVTFGAIVQVNEESPDQRKALFHRLPPIDQAIHQAVARHFGRHPIQKEFIGSRQENAHRRHRRRGLKVVVGGPGEYPTLASPRKRADLDRGLRIEGNPQCLLIGIGLLVALLHLGKDGIGLRKFFWGWLLATFLG